MRTRLASLLLSVVVLPTAMAQEPAAAPEPIAPTEAAPAASEAPAMEAAPAEAAPAEAASTEAAPAEAAPAAATDAAAAPAADSMAPPVIIDTPAESSDDVVLVAGPNQYFSVLGGYFRADKDRATSRKGITGSLIYGYRFSPLLGLELNVMGSTLDTGGGAGTDFYQQGGTVDLVLDLYDRATSWTPFFLIGGGATQNDVTPDSEDSIDFIANVGLGVVTKPFTSLGIKLRAEGRYQYDNFQSGYQDIRALAGIEIPFGARKVAVAALPPPVVEIREVFVPVPFVDSDKDTVEDSRDKCPDTPEGLKVDANGCVIIGQSLELKGVTFEFNSAKLQLNAQTVLDYVVKGMKGQPSMSVEIAGHTDSVGPQAVNQKLSEKRAASVRDYLVSQEIDAGRLTAKGYGETQLLVNPDPDALSRERNRRVVFVVVGQ